MTKETDKASGDWTDEKLRVAMTPIISLWMPWGNWVALGWKPIETRTHRRFASLLGQRIGIHLALKWDDTAIDSARDWLTDEQIEETNDFLHIGGAVICTAFVSEFRALVPSDSRGALIECDTQRYGLFLTDVQTIPVVCMRGRQGVWKACLSPDVSAPNGVSVPAESENQCRLTKQYPSLMG